MIDILIIGFIVGTGSSGSVLLLWEWQGHNFKKIFLKREIVKELQELKRLYPTFLSVTSASKKIDDLQMYVKRKNVFRFTKQESVDCLLLSLKQRLHVPHSPPAFHVTIDDYIKNIKKL